MAIIDVLKASNIAVYLVDAVGRAAMGAGCIGVSNTKGIVRLHVDDAGQNIQIANSVLTTWNTLLVATTQTTITADNADTAVITLDTPDANMDYYVWLDGVEYAFGTVAAVAGVVTLNLATDTAGIYMVLLARQSGNYATGIQLITAEE